MNPVHCRVKHDPENGLYADCTRACIATVLDLEPEEVPHFTDGNPPAAQVYAAINKWLGERGLSAFNVGFPGDMSLNILLKHMGELNPTSTYLLMGQIGEGNHCVVCQGGEIVHDPAWYRSAITGPTVEGHWQIMVIAKQ